MLPLLLAASLWAREADAQTVQPSVSFTQESYPVWENAGTVTVTVKLASTRSTSTTVRISATQNTAIAGSDFVGFTDVDLTIPAGGLTASRTIQIFNDTAYENGDWPRGGVADGEEFFVSVVSVNGDTSLGGAEAKVIIADDEYTACFDAKTYLVSENAGVYSVPLRLSRQLPFPVKVTNAVVDYLSTEGVDYEVLKGTHTFKPGTQDGAFEIWIKDDKVDETNELFRITALVPAVPEGEVFCSTDIIIRDNDDGPHDYTPTTRTLYLKKGSTTRAPGPNIPEPEFPPDTRSVVHFVNVFLSDGPDLSPGDLTVEICVDESRTTATFSSDRVFDTGEDYSVTGPFEEQVSSKCVQSTALSVRESGQVTGVGMGIYAFHDTVPEADERIVVTARIVSSPTGEVKLGSSDAQPSSLEYIIQDNDVPKRVLYLKKGSTTRAPGPNIPEPEFPPDTRSVVHFVNVFLSDGPDLPSGDLTVEICVDESRTTATFSSDRTFDTGEDYSVTGPFEEQVSSKCVQSTAISVRESGQVTGVGMGIYAFHDTVPEADERITVTARIVSNPGDSVKLGSSDAQPSSLEFVIEDNDTPVVTITGADPVMEGTGSGFTIRVDSAVAAQVSVAYTVTEVKGDVLHAVERQRLMQQPQSVGTLSGTWTSFRITIPTHNDDVLEPGGGSIKITLKPGTGYRVGDPSSAINEVNDDDSLPPATTEFKLLDGGRSISLNEGQEATHKVVIGKPAAQALPCFEWDAPSVVRGDILFDRGRALDSNGCMKSWPGTPHVGYVVMDLYINTNDDNVAGADPQFTIGLKNTRKDGSTEPGAGSQNIGVTVVNDDHSDVITVHPHPGPMAWVEVKEFFDNLSATAEERKFSDGTFCNADTPGTRTVTAPGGTGATRTCVKYFARHATHLKWSTGRATPFSYILRAWAPGEGGGRNFATVPGNTGYSAGKAVLDQTAFACNSPEQRAREVTISVREAADWSNELSSPALASGSTNFRVCAHEIPGRDYTYTDGSSLPPGVRSEPPKDVDQYPATEWAHAELPRAEIVVAESTPYVDIRNARKTKFVKEGRRARFFVELSAEATQDVAVEWRVRPSVEHPRATLGEDVERASGTLVIAQGETRGEIRVKTYEDSHDDDREKFRVRITSAEGAVIRQQRAHAIIRNDDPMPAAWLARFGRTVAEQALDGIAGRMAAPRTAGMQGTLAGQALSFDAPANDNPGSRGAGFGHAAFEGTGSPALADVAQAFGGQSGHSGPGGLGHDAAGFANGTQSRTMTARDALLGSSFSLTGEADGSGGSMAFWGRASHGRFDGHEGTFSLDGEATTALLGADYARDRWLVGLALAQSEGEGDYRDTKTAPRPASRACPGDAQDRLCGGAVREGDGTVDASLTAALPYASLEASERLKLWGALGYGEGEVTLATAMGGRYRADTTWRMAAAGLRGDLLEAPAEGSGPALTLTSDALWARTASEKTLDLAASASDVTRLRLGLEGSWRMALDGGDAGAQPGASLTPKLELGARHDGGDAETGFGAELGGGIAWVHPALGLTLDVSGRTLIAHEDGALEDRGFAAALGFDPRPETERGPSFSLRQDFGGPASGGLDALFQPAPLDERSGAEATRRWTAEAAYGLPAFGGRWTASPHAGLGLSPDARDYTLGWRWTPAEGAHPLSFGLRATRRESDGAAPEHALGFEASARW